MSALSRIKELVENETGLDAGTLGPHALEDGVRRRRVERGCGDDESYWLLLSQDRSEAGRLIDEIVVAESWFFRDERPFEFLGELVRRRRERGWVLLRVLSAPCSQGEEPFSIAMTLIECGLAPDSFKIDAVDLSDRLIRMAGSVPYRAAALRAVSEARRRRFFTPTENDSWIASAALRECVRFRQGNIASPAFASRSSSYQVIFCRNLLIYLRPESRENLLRNLHRMLKDDGVLFLGHADAVPSLLAGRFRPAGRPEAFAYCKESPREAIARRGVPAGSSRPRAESRENGPVPARSEQSFAPVSSGLARDGSTAREALSPEDPPGALDRARRLADAGQLSEAEGICRAHLRDHPDDSRAHYLHAAIHLAGGRKRDAEDSFRKVVYLDREHTDALIQLAALSESRGDERGAAAWRRRLRRLAEKPGSVEKETP